MGGKEITVTTRSGDYIKGTWDPDSGSIYKGGTEVGKARTLQEAMDILVTFAEREKHSPPQKIEVSDSVGW